MEVKRADDRPDGGDTQSGRRGAISQMDGTKKPEQKNEFKKFLLKRSHDNEKKGTPRARRRLRGFLIRRLRRMPARYRPRHIGEQRERPYGKCRMAFLIYNYLTCKGCK